MSGVLQSYQNAGIEDDPVQLSLLRLDREVGITSDGVLAANLARTLLEQGGSMAARKLGWVAHANLMPTHAEQIARAAVFIFFLVRRVDPRCFVKAVQEYNKGNWCDMRTSGMPSYIRGAVAQLSDESKQIFNKEYTNAMDAIRCWVDITGHASCMDDLLITYKIKDAARANAP